MGIEIRHMIVRSTVVADDSEATREAPDRRELELLREEILEECRRLVADAWKGRKER